MMTTRTRATRRRTITITRRANLKLGKYLDTSKKS